MHDDRGEAFKKSVGRTISAIKVLKSNPDLKSTHMNAMLGLGGPGFTVGNVAQSGSSAAGNHYGIFVGAVRSARPRFARGCVLCGGSC